MTLAPACTKQKPVLDEGSFQQLLAAAYIVQEHNRSLPAREVPPQTAPKLPQIAGIQPLVRAGGLSLSQAANLITDRLLAALSAAGISIGLVSNGYLDCVAESGAPANVPGSSLASHSLVATERLKSGQIFDSADAQMDIRLDCSMCTRLRVESLVAAPILRFGEIAGLIEVRWSRTNAFREADLSAIKLMGDLMTELLEQPAQASLPNQGKVGSQESAPEPAPEPASVQPVAESQSEPMPVPDEAPPSSEDNSIRILPVEPQQEVRSDEVAGVSDAPPTEPVAPASGLSCRVCGRPFRANEAFCGYCSMPRVAVTPSEGLQSKWASLWFIQQAQSTLEDGEEHSAAVDYPNEQVASLSDEPTPAQTSIEELATLPSDPPHHADFSYFRPTTEEYGTTNDLASLEDEPWPGEALPRIMQSVRKRLRLRDVALTLVAAALTFGVVSAWPSSTGQLTWFGSAMVRLGLAHNPAPSPVYGNPDASVWVDPQSGLYYCDGSDLYGTSQGGHFSSQRKAQLNHFQPATGLTCQ